jgi:Tol biopolymer transport system component
VLSQIGVAAWVGAAPAIGGEVQWSPDGSLIAFDTGSGAFVVRPDGTSLRRVMADGYGIVWSPDSRLLAVAGPAGPMFGDVSVVRVDGGGLRRIARCPCTFRGASGQSLAWSPDGSRIAYVSGRGNDVSTIRPDGTGAVVVAPRAVHGPSGLAVGWPLWRPGHD